MDLLALLGPLDALGTNVKWVVLVLVFANMGTRLLSHTQHKQQAADGPEHVTRNYLHEATNILLVLASFYMATVDYNGGVVMTTLVLGLVISDFFEFEARKVEARKGDPLDLPKGAIAASFIVLTYALFQTLFFVIEPLWNAIV